jgi:hypothetical protein
MCHGASQQVPHRAVVPRATAGSPHVTVHAARVDASRFSLEAGLRLIKSLTRDPNNLVIAKLRLA